MKRIILLALLVVAGTMIIWSQVPQAMNYKAIAKDDWGVALPNKTITLRFTILQGSGTGSIVYQETHTTTTNKFGLMDVEIGKGTPVMFSFNSIDWSTGVYYIKIEMDPNGGTNFRLEDPAHQLLSVPYALFAESSNFTETDPVFTASPSSGIWNSDIFNWNTAFNWGNHANEGYLKTFTESDPIFLLHPAHGIASENISNWNTAYDWGNHAGRYKPVAYVPDWSEIISKPAFASVATSGSYNDLADKPTIDGSETKVSAGYNVTVTGGGTEGDPYVIKSAGGGSLIPGNNPGDMMYWDGSAWLIVPVGSEGQVLTLKEGIPHWADFVSAAPIVAFNATPISGWEPLTVNFVDQSINNPTSWIWSFGDGTTSTEKNPTHTYQAAGMFDVSLTATNTYGVNTHTEADYIIVVHSGSSPISDFTGAPTSGRTPLTVNFTDQSINNPTSWIWSFGDGTTSTEKNPTHTYQAEGIFNVSLTSINTYGANTYTKESYIIVNNAESSPITDFTGAPTSGTAPLTVIFTDQTTNNPTSWIWSFGDGVTSTEQNPSHTYQAEGIFNVSLSASNNVYYDTETKENYITVTETSGGSDEIIFNTDLTYGTVSDIDGNTYKTITIGTQTWMAENLKTTKYNDGTSIPLETSNSVWAGLVTPAYCWFNNDEIMHSNIYGALYNWYAISTATNGSKNVCPTGYHVPTYPEWNTLTAYLGGEYLAGGKLKEIGTTHWYIPNTGATNETGFTAVPGGFRYKEDGNFYFKGTYGRWWSSSPYSPYSALFQEMTYNQTSTSLSSSDFRLGFSVRCVKD